MRYPITIIAGECLSKNKPMPPVAEEVPCPTCAKPMSLTIKKLKDIYMHYFINDRDEEIDVMCLKCIEKEEFYNEQSRFYKNRNIKIV